MGIKKRGITLSIFILLIALGVQAQPILPELSDFYLENQPVFDFLLFFMIIGGVARIVFEKRALHDFPVIKNILKNPEVRKELKLTEEEIEYLDAGS